MKVNHSLLVIAREARGLTQTQLIEEVPNLSQGNYSRMEKGLMDISEDTLYNIAKVLNFPVSFFYQRLANKHQVEYLYRKRITMPRKEQMKLEATFDLIRIWVEKLLKDIDIPDFDLPAVQVSKNNTPEDIALRTRVKLGLPKGPVDKLVKPIEKHGVIVYFLKDAPDKFDGTTIMTENNQFIIVINDNTPNDRKRRTISHELGHIIMHIQHEPFIKSEDSEEEADRFASEFLMPAHEIRRDLINLRYVQLGDLKAFWKVSKASLIRRAKDLGFIDTRKYTNMMIELSKSGERREERSVVDLDNPTLLSLVIQAYLDTLQYTKEQLSEIIHISLDDLERVFFGRNRSRSVFKIVL